MNEQVKFARMSSLKGEKSAFILNTPLARCFGLWYSIYRHNLIYDRSFLPSWIQVVCALHPVYTVENRIRIQQETRGHMNVDSAGALIDQGWGQSCFQKENCICAATIWVQYIQFIVIYQSVCTHETLQLFFFFFFKLQIDPNSDCRWLKLLNRNRTQYYQVVVFFCLFFFVPTCTLVHAQTVYVCHVSMHQIYIIVHEL